jgi:hypothetical protein
MLMVSSALSCHGPQSLADELGEIDSMKVRAAQKLHRFQWLRGPVTADDSSCFSRRHPKAAEKKAQHLNFPKVVATNARKL